MPAPRHQSPSVASAADRELSLTRLLDAPRHLVWSAWADPAQIVKWFGPHGFRMTMHSRDFRTGGAWRFTLHGPDGRDYVNNVVLLEVKEPERIVYKHVPEPGGEPVRHETTVTFAARGDKTELTLHMVFPTAEELAAAIRDYGADKGLVECFDRLTESLALRTEGFEISRVFDAPVDLLFKVWTERDHLAKWWGPKGCTVSHASIDLRPGGVFHYCIKAPGGGEMWGRFLFREVLPPHRLVYVYSFSDARGGVTRHPFSADWPLEVLSTVRFEAVPGGTKLTISNVPMNATPAERKAFESGRESMRAGTSGMFEQLAAYLVEKVR